jgi:hypothetical protein
MQLQGTQGVKGVLAVVACLVLSFGTLAAQSAAVPPDRIVTPVVLPDGAVQLLVSTIEQDGGAVRSTLLEPAAAGGAAEGAANPSSSGAGPAGAPPAGALPKVAAPQRFTSAYVDIHGSAHTLLSLEQPHESAVDHAARHAAALAVLLSLFPASSSAADAGDSGPAIEPGSQYFETTWTDQNGIQQGVVTVRKTGEQVRKWAERHAEGVSALIAVFPPKPQTASLLLPGPLRLAA